MKRSPVCCGTLDACRWRASGCTTLVSPLCPPGGKTSEREVSDSVEWGKCLDNMKINVEKLWLFWSVTKCFYNECLSLWPPHSPSKQRKGPEQTIWMTSLKKKKFDYIVSFSSSWLCLTPTSFALSEKVKHQVWLIYCSPGKKTMIASELWLSLL